MKTIFLSEGLRMFRRKRIVSRHGFKKYDGIAENICSGIVRDCYNKKKKYYMTSTGHFSEFWVRDFGLCANALKNLGHIRKMKDTMHYSLDIFSKQKLATTINPEGIAFDFPTYSPDSLAFMLYALVVIGSKEIISRHKQFLQQEIDIFYEKVIDKNTGLVKKRRFSSMKDHAIRESSCYDNIMAAWISKNAKTLRLKNPMKGVKHESLIKDYFWNGTYFLDDLSGKDFFSADSNVFPFWTKIFDSKKMIKSCIETIVHKKLDKPLPIKYSLKKPRVSWYNFFAKDYQFQNIWPMVGYPYIEVVGKVDKELAKNYLARYSRVIEKNKTFLEVYTPEGKPYSTKFYYTDEGIIWASMHLYLRKKLSS